MKGNERENGPEDGRGVWPQDVITATRTWIEKAIIGLNFCPFAKAVYVQNQIRYAVSDATTTSSLLDDLVKELKYLAGGERPEPTAASRARPSLREPFIDTCLLIHPHVLNDFLEYNAFLETVTTTLRDLNYVGVLQVASFHPHYQFADEGADAVENFTNRSPFPMLHLLREESVARAIDSFGDTDAIFKKNKETLRRLGVKGWHNLKIPHATHVKLK